MKVLVEASDLPDDLFYPIYSGEVLAETPERYLVKHHLFLKSWVPKNGHMIKCREITVTPNRLIQ